MLIELWTKIICLICIKFIAINMRPNRNMTIDDDSVCYLANPFIEWSNNKQNRQKSHKWILGLIRHRDSRDLSISAITLMTWFPVKHLYITGFREIVVFEVLRLNVKAISGEHACVEEETHSALYCQTTLSWAIKQYPVNLCPTSTRWA